MMRLAGFLFSQPAGNETCRLADEKQIQKNMSGFDIY